MKHRKKGNPATELVGRLSPAEVRIIFTELRKKRRPRMTVASALDAWGKGAKAVETVTSDD